jgi:SNF2 family DNA or RNA helicase
MTSEGGFLFDKLVVLNTVYNNSVVQQKTQPQASVIKTPLYPHQSVLVNAMHIYRDKMTRGFLLGNQAINAKIGILGDVAGSGKTLSVLSYLASQVATFPRMTCELTNHSSKYFFSHELYSLNDASSTNLIIVPHSLFAQWKQEISKHTTMSYVPIETRRFLKDDTARSIVSSNFVLTTNKCYKFVQEFAIQNGIQWNNVFIDEASSIYINSADPPLRFQFLWFITNNWIPLIFKNPSISKSSLYYIRDRVTLHPDLEKWLLDSMVLHYESNLVSSAFFKEYLPFFHINRGSIVLRCSNDLINSSIKLPLIRSETVLCRPNLTINSLTSYYLARNLEPNITSSKIPNLFQALGIPFKTVEEYIQLQPQLKHNLIRRKAEENECVICLEQCERQTIVNCCYNLYCAKCLLKNTILNQKCPTCREVLGPENICCLLPLIDDQIIQSRNKMEVCLELFQANKLGKFIIYSSFDNIYYQMFEEIDKLGLKAERIENNLFSLLKTVKNFQEEKTNILFVSNIDLIRGLSLPFISHLIFFHELPVYEMREVLIHSAQRIGRKQPLKIVHLNSEIQL